MLIKPTQKIKYILIILFALLCCQHTVWAEVATATDHSDVIVAGKIIQDQQKNSSTSSQSIQVPILPKVTNDMEYGESIRNLPTLNQPVIDQAKVLSEAEIQQLN